ncbi:hypothetical protein cand_003940 [Cryptosporidium andersoni]|uniref:C2H2-type domain-containing protein n=1 Tax=Cryptosporidium andersoni TaxID=117008 RepID=A0A1J4MLQ9_9CRYT|nr:hypothetical protein cand_003940 [Cryptosporidium andersoni]
MGLGQKKSKSRGKAKNRAIRKVVKTKRRTKDFDIGVDLLIDTDLPGKGQYYCISCARYFIDNNSLENHKKTKSHKRSLKRVITEDPWNEDNSLYAAEMTK